MLPNARDFMIHDLPAPDKSRCRRCGFRLTFTCTIRALIRTWPTIGCNLFESGIWRFHDRTRVPCIDPVVAIESKNMKHLALLLLLALVPLSARAATLSGTVVDSQGAAIPKAHLAIHWDSVGLDGVKDNLGTPDNKTATTDATGHFSLELPAGVYDIFVSAAGFAPHCEKITLTAKRNLRYEVRLSVTRMLKIKVD
jgi:Carboxypeptidase regulatory-like domain